MIYCLAGGHLFSKPPEYVKCVRCGARKPIPAPALAEENARLRGLLGEVKPWLTGTRAWRKDSDLEARIDSALSSPPVSPGRKGE